VYRKPSLTQMSSEQLAELLGPVETQYNGNIITPQCGGCDALSVTVSSGNLVRVNVTAPDCNGQTTGFRLTAQPTAQLPGINVQPQVFLLDVNDGTFDGDVWTFTSPLGLSFTGNITVTVDVLNNQGSTGSLCSTTTTVSLR